MNAEQLADFMRRLYELEQQAHAMAENAAPDSRPCWHWVDVRAGLRQAIDAATGGGR